MIILTCACSYLVVLALILSFVGCFLVLPVCLFLLLLSAKDRIFPFSFWEIGLSWALRWIHTSVCTSKIPWQSQPALTKMQLGSAKSSVMSFIVSPDLNFLVFKYHFWEECWHPLSLFSCGTVKRSDLAYQARVSVIINNSASSLWAVWNGRDCLGAVIWVDVRTESPECGSRCCEAGQELFETQLYCLFSSLLLPVARRSETWESPDCRRVFMLSLLYGWGQAGHSR